MKGCVLCVFVGLTISCFADEHDYYLISGTDDKSNFYTGATWRNADDAPASKAKASNRYWINGTVGFHDSGDFAGDRLAFGTPLDQADSPVPIGACSIRLRSSGPWNISNLALYQGQCASYNSYRGVIQGDATVYTAGKMTFKVFQNGDTSKGVTRSLDLAFALHGATDTSLVLSCGSYPTDPTFLYLSGDFSDYHGKWSATGRRLYFNTESVMGCEADGAASDVFSFTGGTQLLIANEKSAAMSRTRGVTVNSGITLTLCTTNWPYACDDYLVPFPIYRGGSSSVLTKDNDGRVTLDNTCAIVNINVLGGTLAFGPNFRLTDKLPIITVAEGATLDVTNGLRLVVSGLTYGGEALAPGYYSGDATQPGCRTCAGLTGKGIVFVYGETPDPVEATWNHEGAGGVLSADVNWVGETAPNLADGSARLCFAEAGSEAVVDVPAIANGLELDAPGDFTLKGASPLTLLGGGLTATADDDKAHVYTFEAPVYVQASQTWSAEAGANAENALVFDSALRGDTRTAMLTKTGAAPVFLKGDNPFRGALNFTNGRLTISGTLGVDPETDGALTGDGNTGSRFTFTNAVLNKAFGVTHCKQDDLYVFPAGTTNVFRGKITHSQSATFYMYDNTEVSIEGGYEDGGKFWQRGSANSWLYIRKTPISIGTISGNYLAPFSGHMVWQVANNTVNYVGFNYAKLNWRTDVDYALGGKSGVQLFYTLYTYSGVSTLDLTTTRQCIQQFSPTSGVVRVTGAAGSCLELSPTLAEQPLDLAWADFTGAVSVQKQGPNTLVLSNGVASTTGDLSVTNGTLALDASAKWSKGLHFRVSGQGILRLADKRQYDYRQAELHLSEGGKIEIPEGVTLRFAAADLNGTPVQQDTYEAGDEGIAAHIIGKGRLQLGKGGCILIFR